MDGNPRSFYCAAIKTAFYVKKAMTITPIFHITHSLKLSRWFCPACVVLH